MTLGTGGQGDSSLVHRRVRVHFCLDPMDAMASGASGRIGSPPGRQHAMDAIRKLFHDVRMTGTAGLGNIRPEDR